MIETDLENTDRTGFAILRESGYGLDYIIVNSKLFHMPGYRDDSFIICLEAFYDEETLPNNWIFI